MIKAWNKKDSINGVAAEEVMSSMRIPESEEVFLVVSDNGETVKEIQFKSTICDIFGIGFNLDCQAVGEQYLVKKAEQEAQAKKDVVTLEQQGEKIKTLEEENANINYTLMMGGLI